MRPCPLSRSCVQSRWHSFDYLKMILLESVLSFFCLAFSSWVSAAAGLLPPQPLTNRPPRCLQMRGAASGLIVSHLLLFVAAFQAPAPAGNLLHTECGVNQQRNCGQFRTRCRANRNPAFCFRRSVSQSLSHSTAVHMNAGGVAGGSDAATQDEIATRIRLIWELEDAVQSRDFIKAQELQSKLRRIFALREDELLPIGKDAFKGKVILVAGGNGRLGSQVVRELLRRGCSVRATIRSSDAVRDYARLSYEIGAEEGLGDIVAPWVRKSVQMTATAQMGTYGLGRLTVVECDLMDETSVAAAMRDVDSVIWCATDFDGGRPKLEAPGTHFTCFPSTKRTNPDT